MIEAKGEMFVIPNKVWTWKGLASEERQNCLKKVCQSFSGWTEKTRMVQVWITSKDLHTENLACDGGYTRRDHDDPGNISINLSCNSIPYKIIKDIKEGESITLDLPITVSVIGDNDTIDDDILRITLTACQKDYAYRSLGTFEEAVRYVCRA